MSSSYHSNLRSTQSVIFPCLGEAKVSAINSDLTNLNVKTLNEFLATFCLQKRYCCSAFFY